METVGADHTHHGFNAGDGQKPRAEPDLGFTVWRRHISPGLIPHTQSSRIWRQASQVGQVPLMRHITERLGTGNISVSRTWDSLPFVMVGRMPIVQARTVPSVGSTADHKNQSEGQGLAGTPRSKPDGSRAIALDSKGLDGHATAFPIGIQRQAQPVPSDQLPFVQHSFAEVHNPHQGGETEAISNSGLSESSEPSMASPVNIQRQAQPVPSDQLPFVQHSAAEAHNPHQDGETEVTSNSGLSQSSEPSMASPMILRRATPPVTSEHFPLAQRSAAGMHESYQDGVSDASGLLSESPISQATPQVFSPISSISMDAVPSSPIVRRVNRASAGPVSTGDTTVSTATRRSGSDKSPEVFVTEGVIQGLSSITGQDLTLLRHSLAKEAGATSSLVLEAPIVRRALRRDTPTVSDESGTDVRADNRVPEETSGYRNSNPDLTFVQSLSHVQKYPDGVVANGDSDSPHGSPQASILRMRQAEPFDTQPMSASSVRRDSPAIVPIILRNVRPATHRTFGVESIHESVLNSIQRQKDSHVAAKGAVSSPFPLLPLVQPAERPLTSSDPATLIWRSPIPVTTTGAPSFDGFGDDQPGSGSVSRNLLPFIARQAAHSTNSNIPQSGIPSLHERPALVGSQEASTSVNHAEVAEQVSRLLTRQLEVERERRGVCL